MKIEDRQSFQSVGYVVVHKFFWADPSHKSDGSLTRETNMQIKLQY